MPGVSFTVQQRVEGGGAALHVERAAGAVCVAAIYTIVESVEVAETMAAALARTSVAPGDAWPGAVAAALSDLLDENARLGRWLTHLVYLGVHAGPASITVVHAGDIRACLFEDGEAVRCTRDHTTRFDPAAVSTVEELGGPELRALAAEGAILTASLGVGAGRSPAETRWAVRRDYTLYVVSEAWHQHRALEAITREQLEVPAAIAPSLWVRIRCAPP